MADHFRSVEGGADGDQFAGYVSGKESVADRDCFADQ